MLGRGSKKAVIERSAGDAGARAAEVASELAERALHAAKDAQRVATPVLVTAAQSSAETLSHAAEKAAEVLADTADRLQKNAPEQAEVARKRLADASEALADAIRPRKRRRFRKLLIGTAVVGGVVVLVKSPLKSKLADRLFGAPPDDEPESITLPMEAPEEPAAPARKRAGTADTTEEPPAATGSPEGNGAVSGTTVKGDRGSA